MITITSINALQSLLAQWREAAESIALVPTMGNLHAGHIRLVAAARSQSTRVVVSIFVNPTQFGVGEDFESYPRTLAEDSQQLSAQAVDVLFLPTRAEMFPDDAMTTITVAGLSQRYCGASRPGHFSGVATVVAKLFNLVRPDTAFFGEKDFQQLIIIRKMVRDLNFPITLQGVATVREADGLAMSSRNGYLTPEQRKYAPLLYQFLCAARHRIMGGERDYTRIEADYYEHLRSAGFEPDYIAICRVADLMPAKADDVELIILAAAKLGKPRLIDNISVTITTPQ